MSGPDITATLIFHREGALAIPALQSFDRMVGEARASGIEVETQAILDRPDDLTRHIVGVHANALDSVKEVDFGDLGLSRNAGVKRARGRFLAFFDGDDLWGANWLRKAHTLAACSDDAANKVWHPSWLYYFAETDFDKTVLGDSAHPDAKSFLALHHPSTVASFDRRTLILNNIWTANVFAAKELHLNYPYISIDESRGIGVEDWSWNIKTIAAGVAHLIVNETVHLIRQKASGSLGTRNLAAALLPSLPPDFLWTKPVS